MILARLALLCFLVPRRTTSSFKDITFFIFSYLFIYFGILFLLQFHRRNSAKWPFVR
jgi:hypothetical protein